MKLFLLLILLLPSTVWAGSNHVLLYDGYGSSQSFVIEGRIVAAEKLSAPKDDDAWHRNLRRTLSTMKNSERENVKIQLSVGGNVARASSDEEGYFRVTITPTQALAPGWHTVTARGKNTQGEGRVLIVPRVNTLGVISDVDDTALISEVPDKTKLLKNTFLKNPIQRQTFPGTGDFYRRLLAQNDDPKTAAMFYVSASPRQLTQNIQACLTRNDFPPGALVTKQISGHGHDPLFDQKQYKIHKIESIFVALPWVNFVLVGDDGERDPETFQALKDKYPERIAAIYIRKVHPDPQRKTYAGQMDLSDGIKGR